GSAMRFAREKRPDLWIETVAKAMERNDRIYGLMVGDGPRWQRLFETVRDRGLQDRLKLVGRKSPIEPWISAMDLFFLSSAREGLPNVLIEAQSLGVPVMTTNAGGSSETLPPDDTGWLLPEASSDIWAEKLLDVISDPEHLRTAGQRAKSFVHSRFGLEKASAELMQLYNDIEESAYSQSSQ
ncbi:MAG: glycosyltransferase, partial [Pseudomonadota bacterium]